MVCCGARQGMLHVVTRNATHSRQTNVRRFERQVRQVTYKTYYARHIRRISCYELAQHTAQQTAQQTAQHTASEEEMEHCIVACIWRHIRTITL